MLAIKINLAHSVKQSFSICFFTTAFFSLSVFVKAQSIEKPASPAATQQINKAPLLKLNQSVERQIKGGETHSFKFEVKAGFYARAEIEQKNIDVIVSLFAPNGKVVVEMDGKDGRLWREAVSCIAEKDGLYRVELKAYGSVDSSGNYTVKLTEMHLSMPNDQKRLEAEAHLSAGRKFFLQEGTNFQAVIKEYETAIELWSGIKEQEWEAITLYNLGVAYVYSSKLDQAIASQTRAAELFRATKDRLGESKAVNILGGVSVFLNKYDKAASYYQQVLTIRREIKDRRGEGEVLGNLGIVHHSLGQHKQAAQYYEQALIIAKEIKDRKGEGVAFNSLGTVYLDQSQFEKAIKSFEQGLVISKEIKGSGDEALAIGRLGVIYSRLGQFEQAREYLKQSLEIYRKNQNSREEASTLDQLGVINYKLNQYEKAIENFEQSLKISRNISNKKTEGQTLGFLGVVYQQLGQNEKARGYLEQSLVIARQVNDRINEVFALNYLGIIYQNLSQYDKAREYYERASLIASEFNYPLHGGFAYWNLLRLWEKLDKPHLAILYGKKAVNAYQEIRENSKGLTQESKQGFLKSVEQSYRDLARILISEGRFPEAQAVLDLLKEEEFKQFVRKSGEPSSTVPYSDQEEDAIKIVDRLAASGRELLDLKAKAKETLTKDETTRLDYLERTEIPAANKALRLAIETLSKAAPDVANALSVKMKDNNIQSLLPSLGKGVVALYTVVGKTSDTNVENNNKINTGWILLVTPTVRKAYPIDTKDLEQTVFKFREALLSPDYDPQPLAKELYKKLFLQTSDKQKNTLAADLEETLGKEKDKTLMWSLDGILRYIPMTALHDGKGYLVEKYRNVVFNPASLGTLTAQTKPNWEVAGLGISTEGAVKAADGRMMRFVALKDSEIELNSLVKEKDTKDTEGIFPGTLKINKDFTKEALFEGARTGMPVIHISSHFWFNPAKEETSFLVLGNDGKIEMTEFQDYPNLFSNVDLLSLSACDTATGSASISEKADGKETNGKEVEGFAYQAQNLGAKSVMASLWQVSALGTKELMLKFYQIKKEQPELPKGEALRQAQLSLLNGTIKTQGAELALKGVEEQKGLSSGLKPFKKDEKMPFAHPYYWSSFILIGNWR